MPDAPRSRAMRHPVVLATVWYATVGVFAVWLERHLPATWGILDARGFDSAMRDATAGGAGAVAGGPSAVPAAFAMANAVAAALPIAWIYTLTRRKKGFRQSVVQTYLILALVVAGIVELVKHSLALAFALGGIVAAVRFRVALDDSKDAAGIFVVTGIGMAAAVEPTVAWVVSLGFNLLMLALWWTDFGRPAALEGKGARKKLDKALATANRTGMFLAKLDDEVLKSMAPAQLDALADRAWRRRKRAEVDLLADADDGGEGGERWTHLLRLRVDAEATAAVRIAVEPHADTLFKRWRYLGAPLEDTDRVLEFGVVLAPGVDVAGIGEALRLAGGDRVRTVELRG